MTESTPHVRVLKTLTDLEGVRSAWESWPGNRDSEMDSYLAFLKSNSATLRPHVIAISRGGRPDALLVGRIDRGHIACRMGYLQLNVPAKILCFVYGALRGNDSRENCALFVSSVLESLAAKDADAAYMNFVREDSALCGLAKTRPGALSRDYVQVTQQHYAASLPASIEEFYRGLSPKVRKNQKWQAKKLAELYSGDVAIRCYRDVSAVDTLAEEAERLASRSYQRGLGVGFFDTPIARQHLRLHAERGCLRGYVLYLGGDPCAFWIGDINQGTFGSDYLAFDSAFGKYSPGMYLITKVIEGFCDGPREGVTALDFGPGHAQYKEVLSNQEWRETCIYIFAPTIKGISLNLVRTLISGMDQTVKRILVRTKLLQKVKKAWRARMRSEAVAES